MRFETNMLTYLQDTNTIVEWNNLEAFALTPCDLPVANVQGSGWWVSWESSRLVSVASPSIFAYCFGLTLCGSEADKAHIWQNAVTMSLIFALDSFVATASDGVLMPNTADLRFVVDWLGVLRPIPE